MVYKNCKIYGPYRKKQDGREHVVIIYPDGRKSSVSYPKFLVENRRGKYLKKAKQGHFVVDLVLANMAKKYKRVR